MTANLKSLATAALLATYLLAQNAHAGPVGPLTTFTSGTTAKASEVNGNFSTVSAAVNDNASRISTLETNPNISGSITLVEPSTATAGNIMKGTASFIHDFGTQNTFVGVGAGNFTMLGRSNTAVGTNALTSNQGDGTQPGPGNHNTAIGAFALEFNTTGNANTASGAGALQANTTGSFNTATGQGVLQFNTTGSSNTASGSNALQNNTTGSQNTASGSNALLNNTTGSANNASGTGALQSNTAGVNNTASGFNALLSNTTGFDNTASGAGSLKNNVTGSFNTASGFQALFNSVGKSNVAFGYQALFSTTGEGNIALGVQAGNNLTTGDFNIDIGNQGVAAEGNTIRIGDSNQTRAFISGISGVTTSLTGGAVLIDANGQLGTISSSRRFKDHIADMGEASGALMRLRPVTFYYKSDRNPKGRTLQYGLVAEEVAEVTPGLVGRSADGRIETVYYQFLAPMLLNEVQKQQREIKAQAALLVRQSAEIAALKEQAERMAKVVARLERADLRTAAAR